MIMDRRNFISCSSALTLASTMAPAFAAAKKDKNQPNLINDKNKMLNLPDGFRYTIVDRMGQMMDDGFASPGLPDGMACFDIGNDKFALMRNHELDASQKSFSSFSNSQKIPGESYDANHIGCVSRIVFDKKTNKVLRKNLVLTGTSTNCAGGASPWGWLSCEETIEKNHGYVFLCDPKADSLQKPMKIPGYGRFRHEAACVDASTHIAYLTEDTWESCFYRFVPKDKAKPFEGQLQALKVTNQPKLLTTSAMSPGTKVDIEWVDIADADPKEDTVRLQAQKKGAAVFARGEGIWMQGKSIYFCATIGGPRSRGQIFKLDIQNASKNQLEVVAQADHQNRLDMPDNITVTSWGDAFLAEDGKGANYIRALKPDGTILDFAKNIGAPSEFCGVCFDPGENIMFVNLQNIHATIMIEGPFRKFAIS